MSSAQRALIIFPTFNERENIEKIVHAVLPLDPRINVLIVDDSSPDGTGEIADRLANAEPSVHVLHRKEKQALAWLANTFGVSESDAAMIIAQAEDEHL